VNLNKRGTRQTTAASGGALLYRAPPRAPILAARRCGALLAARTRHKPPHAHAGTLLRH